MPSLFSSKSAEKGAPLTHLLLERYSVLASENPTMSALEAMTSCLVAQGERLPISEDAVLLLLSEVQTYAEERQKAAPTSAKPGGKKAFGTDYLAWINSLPIDELLLVVTGYQVAQAEAYYCTTPIRITDKVLELAMKDKWMDKQASFEAAILGFGGEIGGGSSGGEGGYDLESASPVQEKQISNKLKSLGF